MSKDNGFFEHNKNGRGVTLKPSWYDSEIGRVLRSRDPEAPTEHWIHAHGKTPAQALAVAQTYIADEGLTGVFNIGEGSVLSTDPDDEEDLGYYFRLEVLDPEKADEFCMDTYDPNADRAFFDWIFQASPSSRGPQPY